MIKKYTATEEEIEAIKEVVSEVLQLRQYEFVKAYSDDGRSLCVSSDTFLKAIEDKFK